MDNSLAVPDHYAAFARRLAAAARSETLERFRKNVKVYEKESDGFNPVTEADRQAEQVIRSMIADTCPDHGIIGEEYGAHRPDASWRWVIDPVDGTQAFICGATTWMTMIALERDGRPVLGLMEQPFTDECWVGVNGRTQYFHKGRCSRCRTSAVTALPDARLATTDPRAEDAYFTKSQAAVFSVLSSKVRVSRFSFDGYAYALLASGGLDLVIDAGLALHDYAALVPVVTGAGGIVTDWQGRTPGSDESGCILASATPALHRAALDLVGRQ